MPLAKEVLPFGRRMRLVREALGSRGPHTSMRQFARDLAINPQRYRNWEKPGKPPWGGHEELTNVLRGVCEARGRDPAKVAAWALTGEGDDPFGPRRPEHDTPAAGISVAAIEAADHRSRGANVIDISAVRLLKAAVKHKDWDLVRDVIADAENGAGRAVSNDSSALPRLDSNQEKCTAARPSKGSRVVDLFSRSKGQVG